MTAPGLLARVAAALEGYDSATPSFARDSCLANAARTLLPELAEEVRRLKESAGKAVCAYCGHVSEKDISVMSEHQRTCPKRTDAYESQLRANEADMQRTIAENLEVRQLLARGIELHDEADREIVSLRAQVETAKSALTKLSSLGPLRGGNLAAEALASLSAAKSRRR